MLGSSRKVHVAAGRLLALAASPAALSWLAAGCAVNPATGKKEFTLVTPAQESAMGREGYGAAIAEFGLYDDNALAAYVDSVGRKWRRPRSSPRCRGASPCSTTRS
jgi:predicted Zn-dependent protease